MTKGQKAPRTVTYGLRTRAWWVLRNHPAKGATLPQLLSTLTDGKEKAAASNVGKYIRALARAGILKESARREPGAALTSNGHIRYLLAIDCGQSAPVWREKSREVYAPDLDTVYPMREVQP